MDARNVTRWLMVCRAVANAQYVHLATATDPDGDLLVWSISGAGSSSSVPNGMAINSRTGLLLFTPTAGQVGDHRLVLRVMDSQGAADEQEFTLTVRGANRT